MKYHGVKVALYLTDKRNKIGEKVLLNLSKGVESRAAGLWDP